MALFRLQYYFLTYSFNLFTLKFFVYILGPPPCQKLFEENHPKKEIMFVIVEFIINFIPLRSAEKNMYKIKLKVLSTSHFKQKKTAPEGVKGRGAAKSY